MLIKYNGLVHLPRNGKDHSQDFSLMVGGIYLVVGLRIIQSKAYPLFEVIDEEGELVTISAEFVELVDSRVSPSWRLEILEEGIAFWPKEFLAAFFHDDVSEGLPEAIGQLQAAYDRLRAENKEIE